MINRIFDEKLKKKNHLIFFELLPFGPEILQL